MALQLHLNLPLLLLFQNAVNLHVDMKVYSLQNGTHPDHLVHDIVDCCLDDQDLLSLVCSCKTINMLAHENKYQNDIIIIHIAKGEICLYHTTLRLYRELLQSPCSGGEMCFSYQHILYSSAQKTK